MLHTAVIGVGGMGFTHLSCLKVLSEEFPLTVDAIADRLPERRAKAAEVFPKAKLYSEGSDLLKDGEYDVVYVIVPSYEHTELVLEAADKTRNIFCEKPVCLTEEECSALEKKMSGKHVHFMVGQVVRAMPEYVYLKKLIDEKPYGSLRDIVMQRISGNASWGYENWFNDPERSGSVVLDLHIHDLDFLRYALGEPDRAVPVHVSRYDSGMINHVITHLTFGGVQATLEGVWHVSDAVPFRASFRADFDHATVDFNSMRKPDRLIVYTDKSETIIPLRAEEEKTVDNQMNISSLGAYLTEDRYFIRSIADGTPVETAPLEEGIKSVQLCLALLRQIQ